MCELVYISVVIVSPNLFVYCAQETANTCVPKVMCRSSEVHTDQCHSRFSLLLFFQFFFGYPFGRACSRRKQKRKKTSSKNLWHLGFSRRFFLTASMAKETSHKMLMKGLQTYFVHIPTRKISQLRDFFSRFLNDFAQFFRLSRLGTHKTHFWKLAVNLCTLIMHQCIGDEKTKKQQRCRNQTMLFHQQEHGKMPKL